MVGRKGGGTVHHTPTKIKIQLSTHTRANTHAHIYRVHKEQSWSFESCPPLLGFMRVNAESPPLQFCVSALQLQGSRPRCQRVECGAGGGRFSSRCKNDAVPLQYLLETTLVFLHTAWGKEKQHPSIYLEYVC